MTQETKSTYGVRQFAADVHDDINRIRLAVKYIRNTQTVMRYVSLVWGYISILLFTLYGIYQGFQTQAWGYSIGIFSLCAAMFVIHTVLLFLHKRKRARRVRRAAFHVFRALAAAIKLSMAALTLVGLFQVGMDNSATFRAAVCIASVFWLGVTLTTDVAVFVLQIVTDLLTDAVKERIDRVQAMVNNTLRPFVRAYRTVRDLPRRLHLPRLKKRSKTTVANMSIPAPDSAQAPEEVQTADTTHT